jgi:PAS domain-containing protein
MLASACTTTASTTRRIPEPATAAFAPASYRAMYSEVVDEGYVIPAVPIDKVDPRLYRQIVRDPTGERPGTVVVEVSARPATYRGRDVRVVAVHDITERKHAEEAVRESEERFRSLTEAAVDNAFGDYARLGGLTTMTRH